MEDIADEEVQHRLQQATDVRLRMCGRDFGEYVVPFLQNCEILHLSGKISKN